jgi:hypothetical protein
MVLQDAPRKRRAMRRSAVLRTLAGARDEPDSRGVCRPLVIRHLIFPANKNHENKENKMYMEKSESPL